MAAIYKWAMGRGLVAHNPVDGVPQKKRPKNLPIANRPWTDAEKQIVLQVALPHLQFPIALAMYCGLRIGDIFSLQKSDFNNRGFRIRMGKTRRDVIWPELPQELEQILANSPIQEAPTVCANSRGTSWTAFWLQSILAVIPEKSGKAEQDRRRLNDSRTSAHVCNRTTSRR